MTTIDITTFASPHLPGFGYGTTNGNGRQWVDQRRNPTGVIIHTTNGNIGSTFRGEAEFLRDNSLGKRGGGVSAHYLIGKAGQIARIHEDTRIVWHTGTTLPGWDNAHTIGIETHFTPGEVWTTPMQTALTFLVRYLMRRWDIPRERIERHRFVALPPGRKVDPSSLTDPAFLDWRSSLHPLSEGIPSFRVIEGIDFAAVREGPGMSFPEARIQEIGGAGHEVRLAPGTVIGVDAEVQGEQIGGDGIWLHIAKPDDWGFIHRSLVVFV